MNHFQVVRSPAIFTLAGFEPCHKARALCAAITGQQVRIVNPRLRLPLEPSMIERALVHPALAVLKLHPEDFVLCIFADYLPYRRFVLGRECLVHALFHDVIEIMKNIDIVGQTIVIVDTPYLTVISCEYFEVVIISQERA